MLQPPMEEILRNLTYLSQCQIISLSISGSALTAFENNLYTILGEECRLLGFCAVWLL
jgi:hypothetical protein